MAKSNLTVRFIDSIKPPKAGRVEYWDGGIPGFGLRVSYTGRKSWIVVYRMGRLRRRLTLGIYPAVSLADARDAAQDALRGVTKGKDAAAEKSAARIAETFRELSDDYLEKYAKKRKRTWKRDQEALNRDLLPALGNLKAREIKRRDIVPVLEKIVARGAPVLANRTLEIVRRMFNWAISEEIVEVNPCALLEPPAKEHSRDRVLSDDEIRSAWKAIDAETPYWRALFKLRFMSAQRGGEVRRLRWPDLDMENKWWTIPAEFSKNGLSHRVPLTEDMVTLLEERAHEKKDDVWVFPSPDKTGGPIRSVTKATKRIRDAAQVDFIPHDLRRTAASYMTSIGISRLTVAKILNHAETGVTSVYDRHSYDQEKRLALEAWGRRLNEIVGKKTTSTNVVKLARTRSN